MAMDGFPIRANKAELRAELVTMEGTGAAAPTKLYGPGITITRTGEGVYKFTWANNPGHFLGMTWGLGAATPADVSGHTVTHDTYDSSAKTIECTFAEQDFSVFDLADNEFCTLVFWFATSAV